MAYSDKEIIKKIEAETRNEKLIPTVLSPKRSAFLNKGRKGGSVDCSSPCAILSIGRGGRTSDDLFITDLSTGNTTSYSHPQIENGELAKFGNKFWIHCKSPNEFREFELNSNCTATYIRTINIDPSMYTSANVGVNTVNGLTAKDAHTLIIGSVDGTTTDPVIPTTSNGTLMEVDISGSTAVFTPLFQTGYINGDVVYIPSSDTIATAEIDMSSTMSNPIVVVHRDYSGTILGQASTGPWGSIGFSMFCHEGKVIVNSNSGTYWFDTDNYTLQSYTLNIINAGDQANSSSCCDTPAQPSGECYDIGDTGPEGGTIFAVPLGHPQNNGVNQTDFYYEVAKNDIATGGTPSSCFNVVCGDSETTYTIANGSATHQQIDDNQFSFFWNAPPNVSYPGTPSDPPPQVGDTLTAITPNLFADALGNPISTTTIANITPSGGQPTGQGPLTITIADQFTPTLGANNLYAMPFELNITTTTTSPCNPFTSQSVQFAITGISLTFVAAYSINVGDTITSTTPGLVPPGTTVTVVNYFGALTSIQLSNPLTQTSGQYTFIITTGVSSPWSASGAEWGVHNKPNIITSLDFGDGHINTDAIDAYPLSPGTPTGGIHPWLDSHDIAATLCKQTEGWFLPSYWEFREMMDQPSVVSQLGLNTSTQHSENYYWTSSHRLLPGTTAISGTLNNAHLSPSPDPSTGIFIPTISYSTFFLILPTNNPGLTVGCEISSQYLPSSTVVTSISTSGPHDVINLSNNFNNAPAGVYITLNYSCGGLQDPDKYAWAYNTDTDALELAYRCHALSVRPIRRFKCEAPVDGITYDWRMSYASKGTPGGIQLIEPSIGPGNRFITRQHTTKAYMISTLNGSTSQGGTVIFSTTQLVLMVDSNAITSSNPVQSPPQLLSIGDSLNDIGGITYSQFGPVTDVIDIATHPLLGVNLSSYQSTTGANVDTFLVFDQSNMTAFNGPNGPWIGQNYPTFSFVDDIEWDIQTVHPLYSPSVFGTNAEIGHPSLYIGFSRWDTVGNDMKNILCSCVTSNGLNPEFQGEPFNIKVYNQFEELIGDYDYRIVGMGHCCTTCQASYCLMDADMRLVSVNFVEPTLQSSVNLNVLDVSPYWGESGEGHGYLAFTHATHPLFTNLTRGNTLNLEDWRGTGINNRALDPSNPFYTGVSPDWSTTHGRFGWGVVCSPCGGTSPNPGCVSTSIREYLGEVDFTSAVQGCLNYLGPYIVHYPSHGNNVGQAWIDAVNYGCGGNSQSKLIGPSENYPDDINQCFEDGIKEIDIHTFPQVQYDENANKRQRFTENNKLKETGPFGVNGYYPLYDTVKGAVINSPTPIESNPGEKTYGYHTHNIDGIEYYMPNGLKLNTDKIK